MSGPLSGIRIVDLSCVLSGPAATMLLSDQGADVIKVESPHGDIARYLGTGDDGMTDGFLSINRGKRSVAVDLKTASGLMVVKRLVETADVFVQNFRPGAIERMGLGEDVVRGIKPDVVYVSISGFGENGPYAHKRVYDPVIQALSGIADIQADTDAGRPRMIRTLIPDKSTALTAAQAITAGLLARERTGEGQHIRIAMLDAVISFLWPEGLVGLTMVGKEKELRTGQIAQDLIFETKDGYITAGAMSDKEWHGLCTALERPQWLEDERFRTPGARVLNAKARRQQTADVLIHKTSDEWLARLDEHGVPCAPVLTRPEVVEHEQVKANRLLVEYDHPALGRVRQPRPAARFGETIPAPEPQAPMLGQHNREVLGEIGFSDQAISDLADQGVLAGGD